MAPDGSGLPQCSHRGTWSHQGKGSTGKSMGGVRAQFATKPSSVLYPFLSMLRLKSAGAACGLPAAGIHVRRNKPAHLESLRTNQALQKSLRCSRWYGHA